MLIIFYSFENQPSYFLSSKKALIIMFKQVAHAFFI